MHKNFGEWYRLVSIEPDEERLQKRWAGVEEWATALRDDDAAILETVRIFQGLPEKISREAFLAAFRKHDAAFPQRNELELQVLAGASLVDCIYQNTAKTSEGPRVRAAILAGTALETSSLRVDDSRLGEVASEVRKGLQELARNQRKRATLEIQALSKETSAANKAIRKIAGVADVTQLKPILDAMFQSLIKAMHHCEGTMSDAVQNLRSSNEEINILWWLEGDSSRDLGQPWSVLPNHAVPLISGKELADLTDVALGPQDAAALLHRISTRAECKETTLEMYVNAVPSEWVKTYGVTAPGHALDLTPLSLALSHRSKSDPASWKQFFEASSGMSASMSLAPERAARQAYMEAVLLRALETMKG